MDESKRFGYIPSRGRKSDEQIREESGATRTGNPLLFDEEAKRAFHGARGKKVAMVPMYPYNMDYQWKRSNFFPARNVYATNAVLEQGPVPMAGDFAPVRFVFGQGRKEVVEDNDSAEQYLPDTGMSQQFANQPFYSRLL